MEDVWLVFVFAGAHFGMLSLVLFLLRRQRLTFEREGQRRNRMMATLLGNPMDPRGDGTVRKGDTLWEVLAAAQQAEDGFVMTDDNGHLVVSVDEESVRVRP